MRVTNYREGSVAMASTAYEPSALGWVRDHVEQVLSAGTTDAVTMGGHPTVLLTYRGARSASSTTAGTRRSPPRAASRRTPTGTPA
jgi:hypothetical protein